MKKLLLIVTLTAFFCIDKIQATTWNEPWADQVIKEASSFVLAKVIANDEHKGIFIQVIKTISGKELKDSLFIDNFYHLTLCSSSGDGVEFHTEEIDSCYFFINQNEKKEYCIATPTTGFDYVLDGQVVATFRHSYNKTSVPVDIYEETMKAIFNNYHNMPYDKDYVSKFAKEYLSKPPAGFSKDEINIFFLQHVALECVHHLELKIDERLVIPFLNDKNNFHNQVSAARAMVAFNTITSKQKLMEVINDTTRRGFVQVMCIWSLSEFKPVELKAQLKNLEKNASDENDGFGGNIMDPRICTNIPSVKEALNSLIQKL